MNMPFSNRFISLVTEPLARLRTMAPYRKLQEHSARTMTAVSRPSPTCQTTAPIPGRLPAAAPLATYQPSASLPLLPIGVCTQGHTHMAGPFPAQLWRVRTAALVRGQVFPSCAPAAQLDGVLMAGA